MNSSNPFFKSKTFTKNADNSVVHEATVIDYNEAMTVSGTINKSFLMLLILVASATITWSLTFSGDVSNEVLRGSCSTVLFLSCRAARATAPV